MSSLSCSDWQTDKLSSKVIGQSSAESAGFDFERHEAELQRFFSLGGLRGFIEVRHPRLIFSAGDFDGFEVVEEDLVESSVALADDVLQLAGSVLHGG